MHVSACERVCVYVLFGTFSHVHCDFGVEKVLLNLQHAVGERADAVFEHGLTGVSNAVEPNTHTRTHTET